MSMTSDFSDSCSDESLGQDHDLSQWSQIDDKFRGLVQDTDPTAIFHFLETFLKFVRNGPKDSRKFTRSICHYLFAMKTLIANLTVDESYYIHIKNILVVYCVLESRLITCFDAESAVASKIITKIFLLMQRSESVTIVDVLVDIEEIIRSPRSKSVMAIVYRHFLTINPTGQQRVLDDNSYIKHLILYRSWYGACAEVMSEKVNVFKSFTSTIKPSEGFSTNQSYSLLGIDEEIDFKQLLVQPLARNALTSALRDAESNGDCQNGNDGNTATLDELLDVTTNDEPVMKVEVDLSLNLSNETIIVDDEDDIDDMATISYLPNLFERLNTIEECEWRVAVLKHSERLEATATPARRRVTFGGVTTYICQRYDYDDSYSDDSYGDDSYGYDLFNTDSISDESYDDDSSAGSKSGTTSMDNFRKEFSSSTGCIPVADSFSSNTIGPQSSLPDMKANRNRCSTIAKSKSRKKKRSHFGRVNARSRTSIGDWEKRKKLATTQFASLPGVTAKTCTIRLTRLADEGRTSENSAEWRRIDRSDEDGIINTELWHSESSTTLENRCMLSTSTFSETAVKKTSVKSSAHPMNKASKSVVPSTGSRRVNLAALKNWHNNCVVRLKRLHVQLLPEENSSKEIRKCENLGLTTSPDCSESRLSTKSSCVCQLECTLKETSALENCSTSTSKLTPKSSIDVQILSTSQPVLQSTNTVQTISTNHISESNSMDQSLDQTEHITCSPDTSYLSEMNTGPTLNNDEDSLCVINSGVNVKRSLPVEFVNCGNEIPSPVYSPLKGKRKKNNDERFVPSTAVYPSVVADGSKGVDEMSGVASFIASIFQPV